MALAEIEHRFKGRGKSGQVRFGVSRVPSGTVKEAVGCLGLRREFCWRGQQGVLWEEMPSGAGTSEQRVWPGEKDPGRSWGVLPF